MQFVYNPKGVCSSQIILNIEGDVIKSARFIGGCDGNHKGIESLIKDVKIDEVITRLSGITCGFRTTSCPDQLAQALIQYKNKKEEEN